MRAAEAPRIGVATKRTKPACVDETHAGTPVATFLASALRRTTLGAAHVHDDDLEGEQRIPIAITDAMATRREHR